MRSVLRVLFAFAMIVLGGIGQANATEKEAADYTISIGNEALSILSAKSSDAQKQTQLEGMFLKIVDTDWIARFVLGASWRKMQPAQQAEYLQTYRKFLIKHYVSNFKEYTAGTTFKVLKSRPIGAKDQYLVSMAILRKGEQPINLDYRVRQEGSVFHAIDIVVEGVSLLATQRAEFASVIQREGVAHLIDLLKKKAA
jgi:phospholipid transport system substrate-binding protein